LQTRSTQRWRSLRWKRHKHKNTKRDKRKKKKEKSGGTKREDGLFFIVGENYVPPYPLLSVYGFVEPIAPLSL
jgi:hypothetical protein